MQRSRKSPLVDTDDEGNIGLSDRRFGVDRGDLEGVRCIGPLLTSPTAGTTS